MTVQEVIDRLEQVEDKTKEVVYDDVFENEILEICDNEHNVVLSTEANNE